MIDLHTHVFNAAYLPLRGIFQSRGLPGLVAKPLARMLQGAVESEGGLPGLEALALRGAAEPGDGAAWEARVATGTDVVTEYVKHVEAGPLELHEADIDEALGALEAHAAASPALPAMVRDSEAEARIEAELEALPAGGLRRKLRRLLLWAAEIMEKGVALINWVILLLSRESEIVRALFTTYSNAELFVHHMMDMDPHYPPGRSLYPFDDLQLRRMRALQASAQGKLLTFVAFSPFREDGVELVKAWLARGCAGVKFYPPNGYRPLGNTAEELRGTGQDPKTVDARNLELFRLCACMDVPIFAHCQPGEMEQSSERRTGCYSAPQGWAAVLATPGLERLRLCLGHAGGEGWMAPAGQEDDEGMERCGAGFVSGAVELCVNHPNVYLELGCLQGVMEEEGRRNFVDRLAGYLGRHGDRLARRIVYGSDWHMLAQSPDPGEYDDAFREAFAGHPELAPAAEGFFRHNALEYLNLPGYLERSQGSITRAEERYLRGLLAAG